MEPWSRQDGADGYKNAMNQSCDCPVRNNTVETSKAPFHRKVPYLNARI